MYEKLIKKINASDKMQEFQKNSYEISKIYLMGLISYTEFLDLISYNNNMMVEV